MKKGGCTVELTQVIAHNISKLLEKNGLTQADLSSFLGISRQTLSNYLKGTSTIDSVRLKKTADYFNVPITDLLDEPLVVKTPMLFRAAPSVEKNIATVEERVFNYISRHESLLSEIGGSSHFTPEQLDLSIGINGKRVSVNYGLNRFPSSKYKLDDTLKAEIWSAADVQRKLLGLNESGAIELIPALAKRGINIVFAKFHIQDLFGVSVCDSGHGCYIFINSDDNLTIERQLFTVAHEYAHLILHRPLFTSGNQAPVSSLYMELLDKMADCFAGRLLCPPSVVYSYADTFSAADSTLRSIVFPAIRLKHKLNISFVSLLYALTSYGLISRSVSSEYYSKFDSKFEPYPLKEVPALYELFLERKTEVISDELRRACANGFQITEEDVAYYMDCDLNEAEVILKQLTEKDAQAAIFD